MKGVCPNFDANIWWNVHRHQQWQYSLGLISRWWNSWYLGWLHQKPPHRYIPDFQPQNEKNILTQDVTFLQKSYSEFTQVETLVVVTTSYEVSKEEGWLEMVLVVSNNYSINIVSDSDNDMSEEDFKNSINNFFEENVNDQVKISPLTSQCKICLSYEKAPSFI